MQPLSELPFIAGDIALDFVNTAELRGDPLAGEVLRAPAGLVCWGRRYGLLSGELEEVAAESELSAALETRELLYRLFAAHIHHAPPAAADLERLAHTAADAYAAAWLAPDEDGRLQWTWDPTRPATIRHTAVAAATELLRSSDRMARLKQCPGEHCGWLFVDGSKRGNRRWCSMSECGQDAKTARRRQRPH